MDEVALRKLINKVESISSDVLLNRVQLKSLQQQISTLTANTNCDKNDTIVSNYDEYITEYRKLCELLKIENSEQIQQSVNSLNTLKQQIIKEVQDVSEEFSQKNILMYDTIQSLIKRLDRVHIDIINNDDNITITYTDHMGNMEYGTINKVVADNDTLVQDHTGKIKIKNKFDNDSFIIKNDTIYPIKLCTFGGDYIGSDEIINGLNNAQYNVQQLNTKLDYVQKQMATHNGYMSSNNFKQSKVEQSKLTQYAIDCLSFQDNKITIDQIPHGTKIKNTFDNHIWVFNKIVTNSGPLYGWEDFGSDSVCTATNDGIRGLVVGSNNRLRGHIDLNGVISINGLEEEIESLLCSMKLLSDSVIELDKRVSKIEDMVGIQK